MKSLILLWQRLAFDFGRSCCVSTTRDYETVSRRFKDEGVSFLTITLPTFCTDFEKSLAQGEVSSDCFHSFKKTAGLPMFLRGFLELIFESDTGRLLDEPSVEAIFAVRQLTVAFKKILLPCSDARVRDAIEGYIKCEQEVRESDQKVTPEELDAFSRVSALLFRDVFVEVDRKVYYGELIPKHGPGKTADRLLGNKKYDQKVWTDRLEAVFSYGEYCLPNHRFSYILDDVDFLEPGAELPVKVVTVPKTLKTPRIIAIEPTCMQYAQQSLLEEIVVLLETSDTVKGMIGFSDQEPNQEMARLGSIDGSLATIDLSEASDRVSNQHVRAMLRNHRHLLEAVDACRSRKADVDGFGVIRLAKFASMGSALCFPFEAMVFLTIIFLAEERRLNRRINRRDVEILSSKVRVYGDDIIVPVEMAPIVSETLELYGYKVNRTKSFWTGLFRESCGKEFYAGFDVTAVKVRRTIPTRRSDTSEVVSLASLRNQLYFAGLWGTCGYLDDLISQILRYWPTVQTTSSVLGRHSFLDGYSVDGMSADYHSPIVKGYMVSSKPPKSTLSGEGALLKWFLKRGEMPFADRDHLVRQGRPKSVNIRLGMASPF